MRTQQIITAILFAVGATVAVYTATRPDSGLLKFTVKDRTAYGNGGTSSRSYNAVSNLLQEHPEVERLVLKKMPGTVDGNTNLQVAYDIRRRGLKTHLTKNSFIASGAVDLFLAGTERTMECGALIGVHSWSYANGKIHPAKLASDPEQKKHEKFLRDMGIDPAFYVFTREAALPDDLYFLTPEEIERFGLLTEASGCE